MENPEKLATLGTQDEHKQNKKHSTICWTPLYANKHKYEPSYEQLEVKTNRTSFLYGNRNGHHNTELRSRHKKLKRWATRTTPKTRVLTQVFSKGRQVLTYYKTPVVLLIYTVKSSQSLCSDKERKIIRKK